MKPTLQTRLSVIAVTLWLGLGAVLLGAGGDDPSRVSLTGLVNLDGQPLDRGSIYFRMTSPSGDLITGGALIHQGRFSLPETDPIVPGTYMVRVSGLESFIPRELLRDDPSLPREPLPECYNAQSILKVVIPRGGKQSLKFDLKS